MKKQYLLFLLLACAMPLHAGKSKKKEHRDPQHEQTALVQSSDRPSRTPSPDDIRPFWNQLANHYAREDGRVTPEERRKKQCCCCCTRQCAKKSCFCLAISSMVSAGVTIILKAYTHV